MSPSDITEPVHPWPKLQGEGHWVSVDTETTGLYVDDPCQRKNCGCGRGCHITVVSLTGDGWSVAIPFDVRDTLNEWPSDHVENGDEFMWDDLLEWLSKQNLIFQHAKFDLDMLRRGAPNDWAGVELVNSVKWDTKLASWIRWPLETTSLKPTAERLWGNVERKEQTELEKWLVDHKHKKYEMWYAPPSLLLPYARQDTDLTYKLWKYQKGQEEYPDGKQQDLDQRELAVMQTLSQMEARGIGFNIEKAKQIEKYLLDFQQRMVGTLPFEPTRAKALAWWEANNGGAILASLPKTDQGAVSLDDKSRAIVLAGVGGGGLPKLQHSVNFFRYLDIDLALSRYYNEDGWRGKVGKDGRLRPDYRQDGTTSMRFSCSRVNLQAIPQDWKTENRYPNPRQCFEPRQGYKLVDLDLSQAEMRVATAVSGCKAMRQIILGGGKIHDETCTRIFGITETDKDWKKLRHVAKILNFAILYGAGAAAVVELLSDKMVVTEIQARDWIEKYRESFPEFVTTMKQAQAKADKEKYVTLVSGRRRYFAKDESTYKAFNAVIQGNVAEAMKDWMLWIDQFYPGILLLQVHDSVVLEVPDNEKGNEIVLDIIRAGEKQMTETFGIKMVVDSKPFNETHEEEPIEAAIA